MQRAKKRLDRSIAHMDPYDTAMQQWCAAAAAKLLRSAAMPESDWPEVDRLVNGFEYHFGDISEWPNDMVRVHPVDSTETVTCFSGQPGSSAMSEGHKRSARCHQFVRI